MTDGRDMVPTLPLTLRMSYQFTTQVLIQTDLDPAILLDLQTGHYFEANASANQLVLGIQQAESKAQLLARLQAHFSAPDAQLIADLDAQLSDWLQRGWIQPRP
ncbi:PqqD family protein [Ahniella affigens]|nr:PqqD family protein [Ahniella affigens]